MDLSWKSVGWHSEYRLFREKTIVGLLKRGTWTTSAYGEFHGYLLRFEAPKLGRQTVRILDIEGQKVLGTIRFRRFPASATITYDGLTYHWRYLPWSRRRWRIEQNGEQAEYQADGPLAGGNGTITYEELHPAAVLTGLYVHSFFGQRTRVAVLLVLLLPALVRLLG
jgi:hypothetical protein